MRTAKVKVRAKKRKFPHPLHTGAAPSHLKRLRSFSTGPHGQSIGRWGGLSMLPDPWWQGTHSQCQCMMYGV